MTLDQLITDSNDVKNTTSGLVEWDSNSLQVVVVDIQELFLERGLMQVADVAALQLVSGHESNAVSIDGTGYFLYSSTGTPDYQSIFPAAGGGVWKLQYYNASAVTALSQLTDVNITSPTNGQALTYDLATEKWINSAIVTSWSTLSGKPRVVQEMTFGSALSTYNIGFNDILPDATSNAYGNIFLGAVAFTGFTTGTYNVVAAPRGLSNYTQGVSSVIISNRTSLHSGSLSNQIVNNSLILGDSGNLDDLYSTATLSSIMALGCNGELLIAKDSNGQMHFKYNPAFFSSADFVFNGDMYLSGDFRMDGALDCNGAADFAGQVTINGNLLPTSISSGSWTDFTNLERGTGWLFVAGNIAAWRIDPMGMVSFTGTLYGNVANPSTTALTFADASITPSKNHTFSLPRTVADIATSAPTSPYVGEPVTGLVKTDGTLMIYATTDYSLPKNETVWLSGIKYYID